MKFEINLKIIFLLILLLDKFDVYSIFMISILCHEIAHMIIGMIFGYKPKSLKVNSLGVSISFYNYDENIKKGRYKRIFTYLAGPSLNFILAIIIYFTKIEMVLKTKIIYTNLLIGLFNLLPILPLDGGKILKEFLSIFFEYTIVSKYMIKSTKVLLSIFTIFYSVAIFKIKNFAIFLIILYLWYLYIIEEKRENLVSRAYKILKEQ